MMDDMLTHLEPAPSVSIDEYEAQPILQRRCPVSRAEIGFSCTVPVWGDFQVKRQQVLTFHSERAAHVAAATEGGER